MAEQSETICLVAQFRLCNNFLDWINAQSYTVNQAHSYNCSYQGLCHHKVCCYQAGKGIGEVSLPFVTSYRSDFQNWVLSTRFNLFICSKWTSPEVGRKTIVIRHDQAPLTHHVSAYKRLIVVEVDSLRAHLAVTRRFHRVRRWDWIVIRITSHTCVHDRTCHPNAGLN